MARSTLDVVDIEAPTFKVLELRFPPNMRLHGGRYGRFQIVKRHSRLRLVHNPSPILKDLTEELRHEVEDITEITGDYFKLTINLVCEGAIDNVLQRIVKICYKHGFKTNYQARYRPPTGQPRFAV